jgi:hypothetical protein
MPVRSAISLLRSSLIFVRHSRLVLTESPLRLEARLTLGLNSVNQLIFVIVKFGVLFEVRTEFLYNS